MDKLFGAVAAVVVLGLAVLLAGGVCMWVANIVGLNPWITVSSFFAFFCLAVFVIWAAQ